MPGNIQKPLIGFADHIGLYRSGRVPMDWGPLLTPIIDAERWLEPPEYMTLSGTLPTNAASVAFVIPPNEHWLLWRFSWTAPSAQTGGVIAIEAFTQEGGISWPLFPQNGLTNISAPSRLAGNINFPKGLLLANATALGVRSNTYTAPVPTNVVIGAWVNRIST